MIQANPTLPMPAEKMILLADHNAHIFVPAAEVGQRLEAVAIILSQRDLSLGAIIRAAAVVALDWLLICEPGDVMQLPMLNLTMVRIGVGAESRKAIGQTQAKPEPRIVSG